MYKKRKYLKASRRGQFGRKRLQSARLSSEINESKEMYDEYSFSY